MRRRHLSRTLTAAAITSAIALAGTSATAQTIGERGVAGFAYLQMPFGKGVSAGTQFGLKLQPDADVAGLRGGAVLDLASRRPALFHLGFAAGTRGPSTLSIGGVNTLRYDIVYNQNGEAERRASGIDTGLVVAGAIAVGVGVVVVASDSGSSSSDNDDDNDDAGGGDTTGGSGSEMLPPVDPPIVIGPDEETAFARID